MKELKLIKSECFGDVECDIYGRNEEIYMTLTQLAHALGYSDKKGIENLIDRNPYLKDEEFSFVEKVPLVSGGTQNSRVFTEDGIYEVTMLARTETAKKFRAWFRGILKALRSGKAKIVKMTEYQKSVIEARERRDRVEAAKLLNQIAGDYTGTYRQILQAYAAKELVGKFALPLPEMPEETFTAEQIGNKIGISANKVGRIANAYGLKTEEYGKWFVDKSPHSTKEVRTFRYFESAIPKIATLAVTES